MLQQTTAHTEDSVIGGKTAALELSEHFRQGVPADAVTLNDADIIRKHPVAFGVRRVAEGVHEPLGGVGGHLDNVAGVRPYADEAGEVLHRILQFLTDEVLDCMLVVVGVGEDQRHPAWRVDLKHVAHRVGLGLTPPGDEAGMLGVWP